MNLLRLPVIRAGRTKKRHQALPSARGPEPADAPAKQGWARNPRFLVPGIIAYTGCAFCLRMLWPHALQIDDAEQVLFSQSLDWGYSHQGPLYSWMVWCVFRVFGMGLPALAAIKALVLVGVYLLHFKVARLIVGDTGKSTLSTLSLFLIAHVAAGSVWAFTHTQLLTLISLATFWTFLRLADSGRTVFYVLLGLLIGLGALAKYTHPIFVGALLGSGLSLKSFRERLLDARILLSIGLALVIVLPHGMWIMSNWREVYAAIANKARIGGGESGIAVAAAGVTAIAWNVVAFLSPLWLVLLVIFPQALRRRPSKGMAQDDRRRLLTRFLVLSLCFIVGFVLVLRATRFYIQYLQPTWILSSIWYFSRLERSAMTPGRLRVFAWVIVVGVVLGIVGVQCWRAVCSGADQALFGFSASRLDEKRVLMSFFRLHEFQSHDAEARQIKAAGFHGGTIFASDAVTAGKLRLEFPEARVLSADRPSYRPPAAKSGESVLIVWRAEVTEESPLALQALVLQHGWCWPATAAPRFTNSSLPVSAPFRVRLGYVLLEQTERAHP